MLIDSYLRTFKYLRLSLTDVCNFRCGYCLPNGYRSCGKSSYLNLNEIENLISAFKELGVEKVRLTGGEPTVRQDLEQIIKLLKKYGIENVALTTNGFNLSKRLVELKKAGLDSLNISLDSLNPEKYFKITGQNCGLEIRNLIDQAEQMNFKNLKVNIVLLKDLNDHEIFDWLIWIKNKKINIRFIELMKTKGAEDYFNQNHLSNNILISKIEKLGWTPVLKNETDGPSNDYEFSDSLGRIGFISPYESNFCLGCNRLRVSSAGALRLCLWGNGDLSFRHLLQNSDQKVELQKFILKALTTKPEKHELHQNNSGNISTLSSIGG